MVICLRFWDEVSNRKERAVSRRAKALSEKGDVDSNLDEDRGMSGTFGFDDEDHEMDDHVAIEVDLPSGGVGYRRGGLTEDPKANAALNFINELDGTLASDGGEAAGLLEMLTKAGMDESETGWEKDEVAEHTESTENTKTEPSVAVSNPKKELSAADEELSALAELEKELGLDMGATETPPVIPPSVKPSTAPPAAPVSETVKDDNDDFDDDLEDFEGYLQSLTTSPNKE